MRQMEMASNHMQLRSTRPLKVKSVPVRCTAGIANEKSGICCARECGVCTGATCGSRPGGGQSCCGGSITKPCWSFQGPPPCRYTGIWVEKFEMCRNGTLSEVGHFCCPRECVTCGGPQCDQVPFGASRCCTGSTQRICRTAAGPPPCRYVSSYLQTRHRFKWFKERSNMTLHKALLDALKVLRVPGRYAAFSKRPAWQRPMERGIP